MESSLGFLVCFLPVATPAAFRLVTFGWTQRSFHLLYLSEFAISSDPLSPRIRAPCHSCHECRSVFGGAHRGAPKGCSEWLMGTWVLLLSLSLALDGRVCASMALLDLPCNCGPAHAHASRAHFGLHRSALLDFIIDSRRGSSEERAPSSMPSSVAPPLLAS